VSHCNPMNPMKRTSLIVYEADIFKCSQQAGAGSTGSQSIAVASSS
jgi:hypothetical protein